MELLQLRYFIKLAQRQHLTQTAEELMISASSLSATIRKLEKELNVELFERKGRNIRLSTSGKIFYKYISQAQTLFDTAVTEAQRSRQSQTLLIFVENTHIWAGAFLDF
ncbi:LysR family transcriptional regulator, partial [Pyramidobacter piscolens]